MHILQCGASSAAVVTGVDEAGERQVVKGRHPVQYTGFEVRISKVVNSIGDGLNWL